jgi:hypothetical protein
MARCGALDAVPTLALRPLEGCVNRSVWACGKRLKPGKATRVEDLPAPKPAPEPREQGPSFGSRVKDEWAKLSTVQRVMVIGVLVLIVAAFAVLGAITEEPEEVSSTSPDALTDDEPGSVDDQLIADEYLASLTPEARAFFLGDRAAVLYAINSDCFTSSAYVAETSVDRSVAAACQAAGVERVLSIDVLEIAP